MTMTAGVSQANGLEGTSPGEGSSQEKQFPENPAAKPNRTAVKTVPPWSQADGRKPCKCGALGLTWENGSQACVSKPWDLLLQKELYKDV